MSHVSCKGTFTVQNRWEVQKQEDKQYGKPWKNMHPCRFQHDPTSLWVTLKSRVSPIWMPNFIQVSFFAVHVCDLCQSAENHGEGLLEGKAKMRKTRSKMAQWINGRMVQWIKVKTR